MERTKKITAALLAAATVITSGQAFLMTGLAAQQNSRTTIEDTQVPLYSKPAGSHVLTPIASGVTVYMIKPLWMHRIQLPATLW